MSERFLYQQNGRYFGQVAEGVEPAAAKELAALGATSLRTRYRGVEFEAGAEILYTVNYRSRLLSRVLAPLTYFRCHSTRYLYRRARAIDWTQMLSLRQSFAVTANVSQSHVRHSRYAALCVKDAVVDLFRERCDGQRPNVDAHHPQLGIHLHLERNHATLSVDCSGGALHRRGYRHSAGKAPMQETLAAAILDHSGFDGSVGLYDPMCGSGTLLAEAFMIAARIPAGYLRPRFGFESLPDFDAALWKRLRARADAAIRDPPAGTVAGSDISAEAVAMARQNLRSLPGGEQVKIEEADFRGLYGLGGRLLISNPPYGHRLGREQDIQTLMSELGDFLKRECPGSTAYFYFGNRELIKSMGLRTSERLPLRNGGLDGRLVKYVMY